MHRVFDLPNQCQHKTWKVSFCPKNVPERLCPFTEALEAQLSHHQLFSGTPPGKSELS
jgi:hypothetical protein